MIVSRPWGSFETIYEDEEYWLKYLKINAGASLSLQYHERRSERWWVPHTGLRAVINGNTLDLLPGIWYDVSPKVLHRITNPTKQTLTVLEEAWGEPDENDIIRVQDKYGRK